MHTTMSQQGMRNDIVKEMDSLMDDYVTVMNLRRIAMHSLTIGQKME